MKNYIHSIMTDKRSGLAVMPVKALLSLVSYIYGYAILIRAFLYKIRVFRSSRVPIKVISVGNITLGGTGKTPFVIMLARYIKKEMKKEVGVLTRGYGWDEQALLKSSLDDTPVLVRENRVTSAKKAMRLYGSDTVILDDGFQYWELSRDLDIVLIDSRNPYGNGKLFPRGVLREDKNSLSRADVIVLTKVNHQKPGANELSDAIHKINPKALLVEASHVPTKLYDIKTRKPIAFQEVKDKRAVLLSSIGDPKYFKETIKAMGVVVAAHLIFEDHHNYTDADMAKIASVLKDQKFDHIVTTEKDAVKLARFGLTINNYSCLVLSIRMEITKGKDLLIGRLRSLYNS